MRPVPLRRASRSSESGNMLIFGLGIWAVALALALVLTAASELYLERRDLYEQADYLALSLAANVHQSLYYEEGITAFDSDELLAWARGHASEDTQVLDVSVDGGEVSVLLARQAEPIFTVGSYGSVELRVHARATLHERE